MKKLQEQIPKPLCRAGYMFLTQLGSCLAKKKKKKKGGQGEPQQQRLALWLLAPCVLESTPAKWTPDVLLLPHLKSTLNSSPTGEWILIRIWKPDCKGIRENAALSFPFSVVWGGMWNWGGESPSTTYTTGRTSLTTDRCFPKTYYKHDLRETLGFSVSNKRNLVFLLNIVLDALSAIKNKKSEHWKEEAIL